MGREYIGTYREAKGYREAEAKIHREIYKTYAEKVTSQVVDSEYRGTVTVGYTLMSGGLG